VVFTHFNTKNRGILGGFGGINYKEKLNQKKNGKNNGPGDP
jgi:hypothetical protein